MSDEAEDRDGTRDEVTETKGEPQVGAWSSPAPGARWSEIASEAQSSAPAPPSPGPGGVPSEPATEAGRARRPSSLRSGGLASSDVPPPPPVRPTFSSLGSPGQGSDPVATDTGSVSEPAQTGRSGQVPSSATSLIDKIPLEDLQALVKKRPEVGLGIAFAGGLVIATILKRLGRK